MLYIAKLLCNYNCIRSLMRAAATKLRMWLNKIKLDEEKLKHTVFAHQNGFWPNIFSQNAELGKRHNQSNKFDLTAIKNAINRI